MATAYGMVSRAGGKALDSQLYRILAGTAQKVQHLPFLDSGKDLMSPHTVLQDAR